MAELVVVLVGAEARCVGPLVRSACAFGASEVVVVADHVSQHGAHGTNKHIRVSLAHCWAAAAADLAARGLSLCGLVTADQLDGRAVPVTARPFAGPTALVVGSPRRGDLPPEVLAACDQLVFVPAAAAGSGPLPLTIMVGVALMQFASWAGFAERVRLGHKFVVADLPPPTTENPAVTEARAARRVELEAAADAALGFSFGEEGSY